MRKVIISGDFTITEVNESSVSNAVVVSNKTTKANVRLEKLKSAGFDTSNIFPLSGDILVKVVDGIPSIIEEDDEVFVNIINGKTTQNRDLFRRWVMGQMFHALRMIDKYPRYYENFTSYVRSHGNEYAWRVLINDFNAQLHIAKNNHEVYLQRCQWFNKEVIVSMCNDYIVNLEKYAHRAKRLKCKGRDYIKLHLYGNVFVSDLEAKVYSPLRSILADIRTENNLEKIYNLLLHFNRLRAKLSCKEYKIPTCFISAYKGSGAYFTMRNMIMFHDCRFKNSSSMEESLEILEVCASNKEGWEMFGLLKDFIHDNNIDIYSDVKTMRRK